MGEVLIAMVSSVKLLSIRLNLLVKCIVLCTRQQRVRSLVIYEAQPALRVLTFGVRFVGVQIALGPGHHLPSSELWSASGEVMFTCIV